MKKLLFAIVLITTNASAVTNNEIIKNFELGNVYDADWYDAGSSKIAESTNKYRYMKINLAPKKASVFVSFRSDLNFELYAILPCYRIAKLIPYKHAENWGSEPTSDDNILASIFDKNIKVGETKKGVLKGWNVRFSKIAQDKTSCSVNKIK